MRGIQRGAREGFTLVEVMVALVILTFGLLAMAGATGVFFTQIRSADANVDRAAAIEQAVEWIRAEPYDSLATVAEANARSFGAYSVWWRVDEVDDNLDQVTIYTKGRGYESGDGWSPASRDSFRISIARALQNQ